MTNYEYYTMQIKQYEELAKKTKDGNLKTVYTNAAEGFREKLQKLTVAKAEELARA